MTSNEPMSYIARKSCGCIVFAMVDDHTDNKEYRKDLAKELSKCVKQGLTIERVTSQYVRDNFTICKHK